VSDDRQPARDADMSGVAWDRLEDQLRWYDRKSVAAHQAYKRVKLGQIIVGAAVIVVAALQVSAAVTATLATFVVLAEGAQQLWQWQTNWVLYRMTAEALKHERYLYISSAGPYSEGDRHRVLAERLEGLISQHHAKWTEARLDSQPSPTHKSSGKV
jgi:hypothetical protein